MLIGSVIYRNRELAIVYIIVFVPERDATEAFEDTGHSIDARELMKDYLIGELHPVGCHTLYLACYHFWSPNFA